MYANLNAYIYDHDTGIFTETAQPMLFGSNLSACGTAIKGDGGRIVVVAGGHYQGFPTNRVQMYDVQAEAWSYGPYLPLNLESARTVQLDDTFLVVGGTYSGSAEVGPTGSFDVRLDPELIAGPMPANR